MEGRCIFISSCSRRQLARRRLAPRLAVVRAQILVGLVVVMAGVGAFLAGHAAL